MELPISVIIPTYQREQVLINTVSAILDLVEKEDEILILDQTEHHDAMVESQLQQWVNDSRIRRIELPRPSIPRAMNVGIEQAANEIVLFLDDDIIPESTLLSTHRAAHRNQRGDLIAGRVLQPWHSAHHSHHEFTSKQSGPKTEFMGGNFSVQKSAASQIGGFDQNFEGAAYRFELDFAERFVAAGYRIWYEPEALIRHLQHQSGGIRSRGDYLRSWNASHAVGTYYHLLNSKQVERRGLAALWSLFRSCTTRFHLRRPWYIPVTFFAHVRGLIWAIKLTGKGADYPFRK